MDLPQFLFYYQGSANDSKIQQSDKKSSHWTVLQKREREREERRKKKEKEKKKAYP